MDACADRGFTISSTEMKELKGRQNELNRDRDVCKTYLTATQMALDELEKKVSMELLKYGIGSVAALVTGGGKNMFAITLSPRTSFL